VGLGVGMAAGSEGFGGIPFEDHQLAFRLGTLALVLILFDGGLDTPPSAIRAVVGRATVLATVGVVLTAAFAAGIAWLLGLPPELAILVGAVVSSTDAAAVFSVLRGSHVRLRGSTAATIEVESGLNDPVAMILTVAATEAVIGHREPNAHLVVETLQQLVVGGGVGWIAGAGASALLRTVRLGAPGLYPMLTLATALVSFGLATLANGSGFLAVYLAGIVLGGGPLPYRAGIKRVHDGFAWLAQLGMFLLLGLLVFPSRLVAMAFPGLLLGLGLALVARPLAVLACLALFPGSWRERLFVAWVGLRGAVPIVLATYPVLRGVPAGDTLFHLVFFVVLVSGIVPGASVGWLARRFKLVAPAVPPPPASIEIVALRDYPGEFVWYAVDRASAVAGARVQDLPLPDGCVLSLLVRGDAIVAPRGDTELRAGDHVCAFVMAGDRPFLGLLFGLAGDEGE